ncbi:MAG: hypothetical protein ACLT8E_01310 [Akkermansia sp.]
MSKDARLCRHWNSHKTVSYELSDDQGVQVMDIAEQRKDACLPDAAKDGGQQGDDHSGRGG